MSDAAKVEAFEKALAVISQLPVELFPKEYQAGPREAILSQLITKLYNPIEGLQAIAYILQTALEMGRDHFMDDKSVN